MTLRVQRSGIIASGAGGGVTPGTVLLAWDDGTFARTSEASRLTAPGVMAWDSAHTRRNDTGTFGEALTLIESQRANLLVLSEDLSQGSWTKVSATLGAAIAAPDGDIDAYPIVHTASANARVQLTMASTLMPNGTIVTPSRWHQLGSGGGLHRLDLVQRDGTTSASAAVSTAPATWGREVLRGLSVGTGVGNVVFRHRNGSALATTVVCWGGQVELGRYETSYIRTPGVATVTREADQATWLAAEVPLALRTSASTLRAASWWSETDLVSGDIRTLYSWGPNDYLRVRHDGVNVLLEAGVSGAVVASKVLSGITRRVPVDIACDPVTGTVSWDGVPGSAGTPWVWPDNAFRLGGELGGAREWDGGLSLPEAV